MAGQTRLRDYPFVVVRFACRDCPRIGRYRLAVLAERFGADALMPDVLEAISAACPRTHERHPGRRCQAFLPDLTGVPWHPAYSAERCRRRHRPAIAASLALPFELHTGTNA